MNLVVLKLGAVLKLFSEVAFPLRADNGVETPILYALAANVAVRHLGCVKLSAGLCQHTCIDFGFGFARH
jgi:hypothetical protein